MINISDRIVLLPTPDLDSEIRQAIYLVLANLESRYGRPPGRVKWDSAYGFQYFFAARSLRLDANFDLNFLNVALDFSALNSRNQGAGELLDKFDNYRTGFRPAACAYPAVKQGIKLLLVELWQRKVLLLPTVFSQGGYFEPLPFENELYKFVARFEPSADVRGVPGGDARRLYYYMPRVLFAASWRVVEDVSINELAELHRAYRLFKTGKSTVPATTSPIPWSLFLAELMKAFPARVAYSADDLARYSQWTHGEGGVEQSYSEYQVATREPAPPAIRSMRIGRNPSGVLRSKGVGRSAESDLSAGFEKLAASRRHEDALRYFETYFGRVRGHLNWLENTISYPGREHVLLDGLIDSWRKAFKAYIHHRKTVKGYEEEKSIATSLNVLADYLFLYLPWWKELYPDSIVSLPAAPKSFGRYAFFFRSSEEPIDQYPVTFPEILKLRRASADSQYAALKHVQLFFRFVESYFSEDSVVAGRDFKSPVFQEFDLPRVTKRTKTSKVVFPKSSYGYLVKYGYAVEAFGEYLQGLCLSVDNDFYGLCRNHGEAWFDTSGLGFVPIVMFRGKVTPLFSVPNVFTFTTRTFKVAGGRRDILMPHLTTLRMLVAATETGLRLSSLRWLDRRTWDKFNDGAQDIRRFTYYPVDIYIYRLYVNTDKVKDGAWDTNVVFRVRSLMQREQWFQLNVDEADMLKAVPYNNRPHSRFGSIVPLFRSSSSANPVPESLSHRCWAQLLVGFQSIYSKICGKKTLFVKVTPVLNKIGSPQVVVQKDGVQFCPVSILAINTSHSCRATYATNRQEVLETSDIAMQLGHSSEVVTHYYQRPHIEDLQNKLEASDKAIFSDYLQFEQMDSSYIRPDRVESAMARSFLANREAALKQFKVMPALALWSSAGTGSMDDKAVEGLRNGPMSLVRFHPTHICPVGDECPIDVVKASGGFHRCGMCPLALKGIDHLPAISAKMNCLIERIRYLLKQRDAFESEGEVGAAEEVWDTIELDTNEWIGWQFSEEILAKEYAELSAEGADSERDFLYHADEPELVRQHLRRIVKNTDEVEFLLRRIAESNAYPSLQTPQVQAAAGSIRRRLLAGRPNLDLLADIPGPKDVVIAAGLLKSVMRAKNLSLADVGDQLMTQIEVPLITSHLRIGGLES